MSKRTLADYTNPQKRAAEDTLSNSALTVNNAVKREKRVVRPGASDMPTVTFRLSRERWMKLKELALHENTTIQALAESAFESEFLKRGLPW